MFLIVTWEEYGKNLHENLEDLERRLKCKVYHARLVRRKYIAKGDGKQRPLGIPSLEDKIVQMGAARILEAIFDQEFDSNSYGYRRGIGAIDRVKDLTFELQFGRYGWIVEADIKGFFDNLDHDWLLRMLEQRVNDQAFVGLIRKWLKAGILEETGQVLHPVTGTPQGGVVSPVLANIYLHFVLDTWFHKRIKPLCKGRCFLLRYADDYVAGFQFHKDAKMFDAQQRQRLEKFNLEVAPDKTKKLRFSRFNVHQGGSFDFLGFNFRWVPDAQGIPRVIRSTSSKKFKAAIASFQEWIKTHRSKKITSLMETLKAKLQGYWNYYGVRGNFRKLNAYWYQVVNLLFKWLNRRSQRRSYTMKGLISMLNLFQIPGPRIMEKPSPRRKRFLCA